MADQNNTMLTPEQFAEQIHVNVQTVRKWIRRGFLRAANWSMGKGKGQRYWVHPGELKRFTCPFAQTTPERPLGEQIHTTNPTLVAIRATSGGLTL